MNIIDTILSRKEFIEDPPVLLDIGASGSLHKEWNTIAKYSICVAFDPDEREMGSVSESARLFRKLHIVPAIVSDQKADHIDFYLTRSPFCSSLLKPDKESLSHWAFSSLFDIDTMAKLKAVTLPEVLNSLDIGYVDWFKTDSQGIDLRLFKSLPSEMISHVLSADFEPGIIDAYYGEDKLFSLIAFMEGREFWMSNLRIFGSQRISEDILTTNFTPFKRKYVRFLLRTSPGWGEVSFLNTLGEKQSFSKRDYLLAWVFATIKQQHGFAMEIAAGGMKRFGDPAFTDMREHSLSKIQSAIVKLPLWYLKKIIDKLFRIAGVSDL